MTVTAAAGGADTLVEHGLRRVLIVAAVMAATLMQTLDSTITNVALPTIQGNLGASQDETTWVVTSYTIAAIIVIPLTPWLRARLGRRLYYVISILGFTLASVACGDSTSLGALVLWRVVQGAFGGGLLATGQSILRETFPPSQLGTSQGIFILGAVMGPALGPPVGGVLVDNYSWNWCFDINVAPGIFSAVVLFLLLRDLEKGKTFPFDVPGLVLLALGLGSMQYVLTEGEQNYWLQDPVIACATVVCLLSLAGFGWYEIYGTKNPVVDLTILRNPSVSAGSVLSFAVGVASLGSTYSLPQFTQGPLAFTPTLSGLLFLFRAVPILIGTFPIVRLAAKMDARLLTAFGFAAVATANVIQSREMALQTGFWTMAFALGLSGIGITICFLPLTIAVLGGTTPSEGPKASAFLNLAVQLGGSISVAALDVALHDRQQLYSSTFAANATFNNPATRQFLTDHSIGALAQQIYLQADILSYAYVTIAIGIAAGLCIPLVLLLRKSKAPVETADLEVGG